jgi:hypothetical protein
MDFREWTSSVYKPVPVPAGRGSRATSRDAKEPCDLDAEELEPGKVESTIDPELKLAIQREARSQPGPREKLRVVPGPIPYPVQLRR